MMQYGYQKALTNEDIERIKIEILRELQLNQENYARLYHQNINNGPKWPQLPNLPNVNFLYGLGAVGLMALLLPSSGRSVESLVSNTMKDGRELINRANAFVVRTKEGIEDLIAEASFEHLKNQFNP